LIACHSSTSIQGAMLWGLVQELLSNSQLDFPGEF
jgi:hypothetical protein